MRDGYQRLPGFISLDEAAALRDSIAARDELFKMAGARSSLTPPYGVIDGHKVRAHLPQVLALAEGRLRQVAEAAVGAPLQLQLDVARAARLQRYRRRIDGFRWHLDGATYSVILTLANSNGGVTQVLPWRRPVPTAIPAGVGDLVVLHGRRLVHRASTPCDGGERLVLIAAYDPVGTRPSPRWDRFTRWLNY